MVAILEIEKSVSRKEKWKKWWKVEGKIEIIALVITFSIVIPLSKHPLTDPILFCFGALWCFGKIFFRRDQWALLFILGLFFLYKALTGFNHLF